MFPVYSSWIADFGDKNMAFLLIFKVFTKFDVVSTWVNRVLTKFEGISTQVDEHQPW